MNNNELLTILYENKDEKYKNFNDKIINTKMPTIGVRTPILKKIAKNISKGDYDEFLSNVNSNYYEEVLIEGLVISYIKEPKKLINKLDIFLDKIDNWAICDMVCASCKSLVKIKDECFLFIKKNILSNNIWRVRFSFVLLLNYFIQENYLEEIFKMIDQDKNDEYYVMMAKAWLISECDVKHKTETLKYLKNTKIDNVTYNKAISKICDSYRVSEIDKINIKTMKKISKNA